MRKPIWGHDVIAKTDVGGEAEIVTRKTRIAGFVLASLVLLLLALFNLPFQYVETEGHWIGVMEVEDAGSYAKYQNPPRMAGWPLNYWVEYDYHGVRQHRFWSTPRLIANALISFTLALLVYAYIQIRDRWTQMARNRRFVQGAFDVGTAAAIFVVPGLMLAYQHHVASQHRRLAKQLVRYGNVYEACWLPKPIVNHVPSGLMPSFLRLRELHLVAADSKSIQAIVELPTLRALHCTRVTLPSSALEKLGNNVHFASLRLSSWPLSESEIEGISRLRWLVQLNLTRTNLDSKMLRRFAHMQFSAADFTGTPIVLSEIGKPQWAQTCEELDLSRPDLNSTGSLTIDGWPRLKHLSVANMLGKINPAPLEIRLTNLPNLESLRINRVQKHHLVLHDLPRLQVIDEGLMELRFMLHHNELVPGLTWVSKLDIDGAASLTSIECFARDLETISIRNAPSLRSLSLGSYLRSALGDITPQPADADRCQAWIKHLGEQDGPATINFSALPLASVDLSPLVNNKRIRHLDFDRSGVSFPQIMQLEGMDQLESLDISSCRLEGDQLSWLLNHFPKLEQLNIDGTQLARFELAGQQRLKKIGTTVLSEVEDVRVVDLPSTSTFIRLSRTPKVLEIRNAPCLRGIAIEAPWPTNASITGLRDLEWFAGGGRAMDDALMEVILKCAKLDQLSLAYTSISRTKLKEIGQLDRLSLLALPGGDVDDEVTANWHRLKMLWEVNLDDTAVSVETLAWLSRIESLRRLSLNRVSLDDAAVEALSELRQLSELQLAGVSIDPTKLRPLLQNGHLVSLDLSGWKVDAALIDTLADAPTLKHLVLHDSPIDAESLDHLLAASPFLYIEFGANTGLLSDELTSELRRRGLAVRRDFNLGWRRALRAGNVTRGMVEREAAARQDPQHVVSFSMPLEAGRINPRVFRPEVVARPAVD